MENWQNEYAKLLGNDLIPHHVDLLHQVIPQSSLFFCALIFWKNVDLNGRPVNELIEKLELDFDIPINVLTDVIGFSEEYPEKISKAWPWLLKSQEFFNDVKIYIKKQNGS
jgi:hypothetical protein